MAWAFLALPWSPLLAFALFGWSACVVVLCASAPRPDFAASGCVAGHVLVAGLLVASVAGTGGASGGGVVASFLAGAVLLGGTLGALLAPFAGLAARLRHTPTLDGWQTTVAYALLGWSVALTPATAAALQPHATVGPRVVAASGWVLVASLAVVLLVVALRERAFILRARAGELPGWRVRRRGLREVAPRLRLGVLDGNVLVRKAERENGPYRASTPEEAVAALGVESEQLGRPPIVIATLVLVPALGFLFGGLLR